MDLKAIPFIVAPYLSGFLGQRITRGNMEWYQALKKPSFTPPPWVFGPMWSMLYGALGYSSYLVFRDAGPGKSILPLSVYGINFLCNSVWVPIFFGQHCIKLSVFVILSCLGTGVGCATLYRSVNTTAGNLMLPYVAWLTLASAVNIGIWMLNKEDAEKK